MSRHEMINPATLGAPKGFSHGVLAASGRLLFVAGQIGWDKNEKLVSSAFAEQFEQALANVVAVVEAAGGSVEDVCRLTMYATDKRLYLGAIKDVGASYRRVMGRHFPAMALVEVRALVEDDALIEIEGTAVVPEDTR